MATVSVSPQTFNVTVLQVTGTNSTGLGSSFNVGSLAPVTDTALATPGVKLTVDVQAENTKGVANSLTVAVTDPSGSNGFFGEGTITWEEGTLASPGSSSPGFRSRPTRRLRPESADSHCRPRPKTWGCGCSRSERGKGHCGSGRPGRTVVPGTAHRHVSLNTLRALSRRRRC